MHPLEVRSVGGGGISSKTMGPSLPAAPWWIWAAVAGAMSEALSE